MPIAQDDANNIVSGLVTAGAIDLRCIACGRNDWDLQGIAAMPASDNLTERFDKTFVVLPVICQNCGGVRLFSARSLGIIAKSS